MKYYLSNNEIFQEFNLIKHIRMLLFYSEINIGLFLLYIYVYNNIDVSNIDFYFM